MAYVRISDSVSLRESVRTPARSIACLISNDCGRDFVRRADQNRMFDAKLPEREPMPIEVGAGGRRRLCALPDHLTVPDELEPNDLSALVNGHQRPPSRVCDRYRSAKPR
jgi:hypothetical protein